MKTFNFQKPRPTVVALTILGLMAGHALAQDSTTSTTAANTAQPPAASQTAPQLSYGVPEVLQLSQAKVGDSTIINYIHNSGNNYGLNAAQIIYLRQQGVSDNVVNAMLNQRSQSAQASVPAATATVSSSDAASVSTIPAQSSVTYVEAAPASSVYVVPDTQTYNYNDWLYYHSPYYSYYPAYCWPYSSVSVSFIGGRGWVGYRGGWHGGGWHTGGGWHGAGHWHR